MRNGGQPRVERIADPHDADARVLDHLRRLGCNPELPREARHFVCVANRDDASAVADELRGEGWDAHIERDDSTWLVAAVAVYQLTPARVRETRLHYEALAARHGGLYDGWEASAG
jgi:hypothetical protein